MAHQESLDHDLLHNPLLPGRIFTGIGSLLPSPNPWLSALQSPCWLGPVFLPSPHLSVWSPGSFYQLGFGGLFEEVGIAASQGVSAECGKAASWVISEKWRISAGGRGISVDMGILALVGIDSRLVLNWLILKA